MKAVVSHLGYNEFNDSETYRCKIIFTQETTLSQLLLAVEIAKTTLLTAYSTAVLDREPEIVGFAGCIHLTVYGTVKNTPAEKPSF